jgi:phage terminase small subunit
MPVLKNAKYELFAQNLAQGMKQADAHEKAGFKRNDGNASKLAAKPEIDARIKELKEIGAEKAAVAIGVTKEKITAELAKLGFSNMLDYMTVGADGLPFIDMSMIATDRDKGAAIQEVIVETTTRMEINAAGEKEAVPVRKVRFKLADKRAALVDMARHLGMNTDVVQVKNTSDAEKTADQLKAEVIAMIADLGLAPLIPTGVANRPNGKDGTKH